MNLSIWDKIKVMEELKETQSKEVSVVLSFYNGRRYLDEQIKSIALQSHPITELIIVEDGCEETSRDLVEPYEKYFKRVQWLQNSRNLGYNFSFEKGIQAATCEYIALSDQDDIWDLKKIECLLKGLGDCDLAYGDSRLINSFGGDMHASLSEILPEMKRLSPHAWIYFLEKNCVSGHALLFRRSFYEEVGPFPENFDQYFIYDRWLSLWASLKKGAVYCPEAIVYHRMHDTNALNRFGSNSPSEGDKKGVSQKEKLESLRRVLNFLYAHDPKLYKRQDFKTFFDFILSKSPLLRLKAFAHMISHMELYGEFLRKERKSSQAWKWLKHLAIQEV